MAEMCLFTCFKVVVLNVQSKTMQPIDQAIHLPNTNVFTRLPVLSKTGDNSNEERCMVLEDD